MTPSKSKEPKFLPDAPKTLGDVPIEFFDFKNLPTGILQVLYGRPSPPSCYKDYTWEEIEVHFKHLIERDCKQYSGRLDQTPKQDDPEETIDLTGATEEDPTPPGTPVAVFERTRTAGDFRPPTPPQADRVIKVADTHSVATPKAAASSFRKPFDEPHPTQFKTLRDRLHHIGGNIALTRVAKTKYKKLRKRSRFYCELCKVPSNSRESNALHLKGRKHQRAVEKKNAGNLKCNLCDKQLRTRAELDQHNVSRGHRRQLEVQESQDEAREWEHRRQEHFHRRDLSSK